MTKLKVLTSYIAIGCNVSLGFFLMYAINTYASVSVYGQFMILKSSAGLLSGLLTFRTGEAITKYYNHYKAQDELYKSKYIIKIGFISDLLLVIFGFSVLFLISNYLNLSVLKNNNIDNNMFFVFGFVSLFSLLRGTSIGLMQAKGNILTINAINILESITIFILTIYYIFIDSLSINNIIYLHVTTFLFASILYLINLFIEYFIKHKHIISYRSSVTLKEYLKFSGITFSSSTIKSINRNSDNLIIGYFLSSAEVGLYQSIKKFFSVTEIIAQPWSMLRYGKLVSLYSLSKIAQFKNLIKITTYYITVISCIVSVIIFFYIKDLLSFSNVYPSEGFDLKLFSFFILLSYLSVVFCWWSRVFSNIINPMISVKVNICTLAVVTIFMPVSIHFIGLYGVAFTYMFINLCIAVYMNFLFIRLKNI